MHYNVLFKYINRSGQGENMSVMINLKHLEISVNICNRDTKNNLLIHVIEKKTGIIEINQTSQL